MDRASDVSQVFLLRIWPSRRAAVRRLGEGAWTYMSTPTAVLDYLRTALPTDGAGGPTPPGSGAPHAATLRVHAFGRFSVLKDDVPLPCGHKVQKRCLELLKALIALGGSGVPERRLADALWPDAEADCARLSLKATLHRLRKLVGKHTIRVHEGRFTLVAEHCWLDSWEFEYHVDRALALPAHATCDELSAHLDAALQLYQGPLMADDDAGWVIMPRERLRNKLLRAIARCAQVLLAAGRLEACVALAQRGVDIDPLEERFHETLLRALLAAGRHADALRAYDGCARQLRAALGVGPSPAVETLRRRAQRAENTNAFK